MAAMTPAIQFADADVFHARLRPHGLRFRYHVLALFIDLDRLDEAHHIPFFSVGRFNLFGFDRADHGLRDGTSLRIYLDQLHRDAGLDLPARITLTCFPRILGVVFNPISVYTCWNGAGIVTSVAYEVRNTFGEHHTYIMPVTQGADGRIEPHECDKIFYVSPFMDMPMRYRFLLLPPEQGQLSLKIVERDHDGVVLTALIQALAFVPTRAALLARLAKTPLMGFKVMISIHVQALRLWLKGHRIRTRAAPPQPVSMGAAGGYSTIPSSSNPPEQRHV